MVLCPIGDKVGGVLVSTKGCNEDRTAAVEKISASANKLAATATKKALLLVKPGP